MPCILHCGSRGAGTTLIPPCSLIVSISKALQCMHPMDVLCRTLHMPMTMESFPMGGLYPGAASSPFSGFNPVLVRYTTEKRKTKTIKQIKGDPPSLLLRLLRE